MKSAFRSFLTCTTVMLLLGASATVQAEESSFTGASFALGLGAARNRLDYGGFLAGQTSKETDAVGILDASYGFNLAPQWVVALGATYDLNKTDFGTVTYVAGVNTSVDVQLKNHFSLYVAPGYRLSPNWLGYAKLGWHHAKGEFNDSQFGRGETTHNGVGYGLGVSTVLAKQIEARFEVQHIDFNRKSANLSDGKPEINEAVVYLGYRF